MTKGVLVVDDSADIHAALSYLLRSQGYPVWTAVDGIDAIQVLRRISLPGLLLVDLFMPRMDGLELWKHLRADGIHIPIVIATGAPSLVPDEVPVIKKPFDIDALLQHVHLHCDEPLLSGPSEVQVADMSPAY